MIAIIKYNAGNIRSVQNALNRLGYESLVTDEPDLIKSADKVIFPGVGEASSAMEYLREKELDKLIKQLDQPVLGICLGLQLMCSHSEEGNTNCLGIFTNQVKRFNQKQLIPQMGWNELTEMKGSLFKDIAENSNVYFVHSFYADLNIDTIAIGNYHQSFSAALNKENFYATQFHPEKSGSIGENILLNFLKL